MAGLGGPDVAFQPRHQRQIVGQAAQQAHRGVGVGVDQPGHQQLAGQLDDLCAGQLRKTVQRFVRQDAENAVPLDEQGMVFEQIEILVDGEDEVGFEQGQVVHGRTLAALSSGLNQRKGCKTEFSGGQGKNTRLFFARDFLPTKIWRTRQ